MVKRTLVQEKGFSMIELVFVVLIIGILVAAAIPTFMGTQTDAKKAVVETDFKTVANAVMIYRARTSKFPANLEALTVLTGQYRPVITSVPKDPFSPNGAQPYGFSLVPGNRFKLTSTGDSETGPIEKIFP